MGQFGRPFKKCQTQVYNILLQVRSKNGDLEVDPLGKDVGNKSIGGFSQGKGNGNHVPEME